MSQILLNVLYAAGGIAGLYFGAELLVKGGAAAARKAGISSLVIGLTLVAFSTSAPELVVSVDAALSGNADISLGNIVGSNICNIALILGLCACITPLHVKVQLLRFDVPIMIAAALMLTAFYFSNHGLTRLQGAILLACIIAYTVWSIRASRRANSACPEEKPKHDITLTKALALIVFGLAALIIGAKGFLLSSVYFARLFNVSDAVIGLTVVAVGTSLPELATSVVAAIKGENDIAVGNVLGSNIFNIFGILGLAPLVKPLSGATLNPIDMGMMVFCSVALLPIMRSGWKISRLEGAFFLLVYCGYTAYLVIQHG
ncbi:MAG: calcium/sodium antiporter [Victivallaceae bacterium]|nr:calcium/sodium antiporter [Victivallaceae bacterium]